MFIKIERIYKGKGIESLFNQFKISLSDIYNNKISTFIFFFQILICFIVGGYIISEFDNINKLDNKLNQIGDSNSIFYLIDDTDINKDHEIMNKDDVANRLYSLYEYMENLDNIDVCRFYQTTIVIEDERLPESFVVDSFLEEVAYNALYADIEYLKLFEISCDKGRTFKTSDFSIADGLIPIILGSGYKKVVDLGDKIDGKYEIIGFAEENSFFMNPSWSDEIVYLDNYIIMPFRVSKNSDPLDIYQAISRSLIIADSMDLIMKVPEYSLNMDLFTFNLRSYAEQIKRIKAEVYEVLMMMTVFLFIVFVVCTVCMYTTLLVFIDSHIREFTIHLMCGCSFLGVLCRICYQVWIPMLISFLATLIIYNELMVMLVLFVVFMILAILACFPPLIKIYKKGLVSVIVKSE